MPIKLNTASGGGVILTGANTASDKTITVPAVDGTMQIIKLETSKASTSGTSVDFTDIPSWVKRITVMFNGVSTNGTSAFQLQLGDSGGIETTGYAASGGFIQQAATYAGVANSTAGFQISTASAAVSSVSGVVTLTLINSNNWAAFGVLTPQQSTAAIIFTAGSKTLSDTLTQVRITTVNGTDTFDAGTINLLLEG